MMYAPVFVGGFAFSTGGMGGREKASARERDREYDVDMAAGVAVGRLPDRLGE